MKLFYEQIKMMMMMMTVSETNQFEVAKSVYCELCCYCQHHHHHYLFIIAKYSSVKYCSCRNVTYTETQAK